MYRMLGQQWQQFLFFFESAQYQLVYPFACAGIALGFCS
jgi:hypothetical protein